MLEFSEESGFLRLGGLLVIADDQLVVGVVLSLYSKPLFGHLALGAGELGLEALDDCERVRVARLDVAEVPFALLQHPVQLHGLSPVLLGLGFRLLQLPRQLLLLHSQLLLGRFD